MLRKDVLDSLLQFQGWPVAVLFQVVPGHRVPRHLVLAEVFLHIPAIVANESMKEKPKSVTDGLTKVPHENKIKTSV